MMATASITCAGLAALLVSYPSATATVAEATNSTGKIAPASSWSNYTNVFSSSGYLTTNTFLTECYEDYVQYCEDSSCLECYSEIESGTHFTRFAEYPEFIECILEIYNEPTTVSLCDVYGGHSCCLSKLSNWECYSEVNFMGIDECYLDYYECSSEYYSCIEGSASSDAAAVTGNGQLSRLVCAAVLAFTMVVAMGM